MEQFLLKSYIIYMFLLLGLLFLLIAESFSLTLMVRLHGRDWRYILPEIIALCLSFLFFIYGSLWWNKGDFIFGPPVSPLNMLVFAFFLLIRCFLNWRWEQNRLPLRVNVASISEALDDLPMGILFAQKNGRVALVNVSMLHWMETIFGRQFRNIYDFFAALQNFERSAVATKRQRDKKYLFRLQSGQSILFRHQWLEKMQGWQMTAIDVTKLDQVNIEMEKQNTKLMQSAYEQKELLRTIETTERERTLQRVARRVHDIMGSRISMLQQLLQSPKTEDALQIIARLDTMLEDIRFDEVIQPQVQMQDLFNIYRHLGLDVDVTGELPRNRKRARAFVEILREGFNNAVVHGHASKIKINFSERELRLSDNGIGEAKEVQVGNGLRGISQRAQAIAGKLYLKTQPHFTLIVRVEGRKSEEKHSRTAGR